MQDVDHRKTVLANGLRVLTAPMAHTRAVSVSIFAGAGSRYETSAHAGISHFVEHMCFKGTKRRPTPQALSRVIDGVGGSMNAATDRELTVYYGKVTEDHCELALDVLTDLVHEPLFEAREMEKERGVIIEELASVADSPAQMADVLSDQTVWPDQPLGRDVGGTPDSVRAITRSMALDYFRRQYVPNNMVMSIAGAIHHDRTLELVERATSHWEAGTPATWYPAIDGQEAPRVNVRHRPTEQAHMVIAMRGIPLQHPQRFALTLLSVILGEGMSSRLVLELREKRGLCYDVHTYASQFQDTGTFAAYAGMDPRKAHEALDALLSELARVRDLGVGQAELRRAKELVKGRLELRMEDSRAVSDWLGGQELLSGQVRPLEAALVAIDMATRSDIKQIAGLLFQRERLNLAVVGPFRSDREFTKALTL
jgi:predicted Zn-dependent peptidase